MSTRPAAPVQTELQIVRDPRIYLVGKQVVDEGGMEEFLQDHGMEWKPDTQVPAQLISEAAGRVCYMSFGKGRGSNQDTSATSSRQAMGACWSMRSGISSLQACHAHSLMSW